MSHPYRVALVLIALLLMPVLGYGQETKASPDARISNALLAAPQSIAAHAAVFDWPATEGGELVKLREGTNGWTCIADIPFTEGDDPMCLDRVWLDFLKAQVAGKTPDIKQVGIGYMTHGGAYSSNTDPTASKATPDNDWGYDPPHIMLVVPDPALLKNFPTTRTGVGPYVMFAGTPYAHLMIPVSDHEPKQ
jgi:hypothetical protein